MRRGDPGERAIGPDGVDAEIARESVELEHLVLGDRGDDHLPRGHDEAGGDRGERTRLQDLRCGNARLPRLPVHFPVGVGLHRNSSDRDCASFAWGLDAITNLSGGLGSLDGGRRSRSARRLGTIGEVGVKRSAAGAERDDIEVDLNRRVATRPAASPAS